MAHYTNKYKNEMWSHIATSMHLSLSALFLMLLSWQMALLFSMDVLAWFAFISLLCLCKETEKTQINLLLKKISLADMLGIFLSLEMILINARPTECLNTGIGGWQNQNLIKWVEKPRIAIIPCSVACIETLSSLSWPQFWIIVSI